MVILDGPEKICWRIVDSYTYVNTFVVVHGEKTYAKRWVEVLPKRLDMEGSGLDQILRERYTVVSVRRPWCSY